MIAAKPVVPVIISLAWLLLWSGCGGGSSTKPNPPLTIASVSVSCTPTSIQTTGTSACAATVTGTGNYSTSVTWSVNPANSGTVSGAGIFTPASAGTAAITATSMQDSTKSGSATVVAIVPVTVTLVSLAISPANATIPVGATQQFAATGTFTGGSTQNVTGLVTWTSTAPSVATINATALATSKGTGATNIIASTQSITSVPASLAVLPAVLQSIAITPANSSIALGTTQQFMATGTFSDGSTRDLTSAVTWRSSDGAVASISAAGGAISAAVGNTTISASSGSVAGSTTLTASPAQLVSIAITPAIPSISRGTNQQFAATGTFTDHTTQDLTTMVQWSSSTPTVATISNSTGTNGLASSLATGTTKITATSGSISSSTTLTVTEAVLASIAITPAAPSLALGTTQQFTATGTYTDSTTQNLTSTAIWSSSVTAVANVDLKGLAQSAATGNTTITASVGDISGTTTLTVVAVALVSITIAPATASIPLGTTQAFTATDNYADGTTHDLTASVYWSSSDGAVATISNATGTVGLATSVAVGSTTISASSGSVLTTASLTIAPSDLVTISITPPNPSIALGASQQFTATGTYSDQSTKDITKNVTWTSSSATVAVISNSTGPQGLATSSGTGSTTITAAQGSISGSTTLTVQAAVQLPFTVVQAPPGTCIVDYSGVATNEACTPAGVLSSSTLTINTTATVAGHGFLVVVSGEFYSNSAANCSDNSSSGTSNTYTLIPSAHAYVNLTNYGDSSGFSDILYVASSVGSVTQVQCTLTGAFTNGTGDAEIWFIELSQPIGGVDQVAVLDNQSATQLGYTCTGPSITTMQPDEFVLSAIWLSHDVVSVSPPFTLGSDARGNSIGYFAATSTGTFQPTFTSDSPNDGFAVTIASFTGRPAPGN